jgi:hypothetical protein
MTDDLAVARSWRAVATPEGARAYAAFFQNQLVPELHLIAGHLGAYVMTRPDGDRVEITVITFWTSLEAIRRFAGDTLDRAVVEPEARAVLLSFDDTVEHRSVVLDTRS